jgi:hypothetical protein
MHAMRTLPRLPAKTGNGRYPETEMEDETRTWLQGKYEVVHHLISQIMLYFLSSL